VPTVVQALPLLLVFLVLSIDSWVYMDARTQADRGTPVVFSYGQFKVDTPMGWFLGCLILWIVFFPLYLAGRSR
jgi:hypothetical protein